MTIGERIKARRKELQLSQAKLGVIVGVSGKSIANWETDLKSPSRTNTATLAQHFGTTEQWLMFGTVGQPMKSEYIVMKDDIAEKLDELADLSLIWAKHREAGRHPQAIRGAMLMIANELVLIEGMERTQQEAANG